MSDGTTPRPPDPVSASSRSLRRRILTRVAFLLVAAVALYILWPSLAKVFSAVPDLDEIAPGWFLAMLALEAASFAAMWVLLAITLRSRKWFAIGTAQLAGNAVGRVVPGGAAAGAAAQYTLMVQGGVEATRVGTGVTAASLISTATIFALPLLSVPAVLASAGIPDGLVHAVWLGGAVLGLAFAAGAMLLFRDRPVERVGHAIAWVLRRMRRPASGEQLAERLVDERDLLRTTLRSDWWKAVLASLANWLLDYLALLAALTAVGARPDPPLVLLAYASSMVLGMIPLTPGGLGFVEAGLTGTLALAGVSGAEAVLAILAYRLVSYWLPMPVGGIAYWLARRRSGAKPLPAN
ncbi:MAG: flippase-like domain-containing protein [Actinomycetota bacterium]